MGTNTTMGGLAPLIGIEELAEYLDLPVKTLYKWRQEGVGPASVRAAVAFGTSSATSRTGSWTAHVDAGRDEGIGRGR